MSSLLTRAVPGPVRRRLAPLVRRWRSRRRTAPPAGAVRPGGRNRARRLVPSPIFVISSVRSGSTLLRVILNSHPRICAPHEMHLRTLEVRMTKPYTKRAMDAMDLDVKELEHMLWDRVLDRQLVESGKDVIVDKTPGNAFVWKRLRRCWPQARYVFLLRHPASMVTSLIENKPSRDLGATVEEVLGYVRAVDEARAALPGLTVRYEDLVTEPERVTREICEFAGVPWDARMLEYGEHQHGPFKAFIGDWSENIRSGSIQAPRELPPADEVPEPLREYARAWGYDQ